MTQNNRVVQNPLLVEWEGGSFAVCVTYKKIKNLRVSIARDGRGVNASAPLYMSESDVMTFIYSKRKWIAQKLQQIENSPEKVASQATPDQVDQWCAVVKACAPTLIEAWEPIMGVRAKTVAYRNMTSRWGSCQPSTGRICLNVRLALYPPECLEYVVVHELCHLIERGHGPRFKELMDTFMPDWQNRRARLR